VFWPDLFLPKRRTETTDSNDVLTVVHTKGILLDAPNKSLKWTALRAAT
jgi:hypothetical protein